MNRENSTASFVVYVSHSTTGAPGAAASSTVEPSSLSAVMRNATILLPVIGQVAEYGVPDVNWGAEAEALGSAR